MVDSDTTKHRPLLKFRVTEVTLHEDKLCPECGGEGSWHTASSGTMPDRCHACDGSGILHTKNVVGYIKEEIK